MGWSAWWRRRRRKVERIPRLEMLEDRRLPSTLAKGFSERTIVSGLQSPTTLEIAPDGRIFIAEQEGTLKVIDHGQLQSQPFLKLNVDSNGERGLLGIAFDPHFSTNHYVYVYYTTDSPVPHNRVSRFTARGNVAVPGSERVILELDRLS